MNSSQHTMMQRGDRCVLQRCSGKLTLLYDLPFVTFKSSAIVTLLLHTLNSHNQTELQAIIRFHCICFVCSLAVITSSVLSTVSGCHLTSVKLKKNYS